MSAPNRALKSLMTYGDIIYEDKHVDMAKYEHKSAECLKYNPLGTIPFLVVNEKTLLESASLLRFITNAYPHINHLYPKNAFARQLIDAALDFSGTSLRPKVEQCCGVLWHNWGTKLD